MIEATAAIMIARIEHSRLDRPKFSVPKGDLGDFVETVKENLGMIKATAAMMIARIEHSLLDRSKFSCFHKIAPIDCALFRAIGVIIWKPGFNKLRN